MGTLQDAFDRQIEKLPRLAIERIVREKLQSEGVEDEALLGRVVDALVEGKSGVEEIPYDRPLRLEFTNADLDRIKEASAAFIERMPNLVDTITGEAADDLVVRLREQWQQSRPTSDERAESRTGILKDWAEPLDALRLLVTLCSEEGDRFNIAYLQSRRAREGGRTQALARLHIRACRIADEILLLLEHGHTEGAQARWRTLHEVTVTASLIAEGGDPLAARYFDHEIVDRKRALDDHRRAAAAAGEAAISRRQVATLERKYEAAVRKYGKRFQGAYGWASSQLGMPDDPKFHDLQEVAGNLTLKLRYRISSADTHASPTTLAQPVHRWDPTTHVPDMFAAGFEGPGVDTAHAIVQVTALLYPEPWDLDVLVLVMALGRLRDEAADAWLRIARKIDKRERRAIERAVRGPMRRIGYVQARPGKPKI